MTCPLTDRELDAFIAEKVMGYEKCPIHLSIFCCGRSLNKNNFTQDLNACHEAEMKLPSHHRKHYEGIMSAKARMQFMDPQEGSFWMMTADARQRSEAMREVLQ